MARRCDPTRWSWSRDGGKARLLIQTYPLKQKLSRVVEGKPWAASPDTRMMQLLHDTGVRIGLVTNGDQWMLVDAPKGETTGYASWYASLWLEEPKTLQAFRTLLGSYRFFGVPEEETLERLLAQSAQDQQEVTDQLGYQVRQAVEVLVQTLDRANRDSGGTLLKGVPEDKLYEAALTVMMRLVFLFCAEERDLLLLGDELYDKNYAVSTLREQLRVTANNFGEEVMERRHDAWSRLLTTFRAVYGGVQHHRLKLPAYQGELFDPDRFPFLEGRTFGTRWKDTPCQPIPVDNRTVLHLLDSLQVLQVRLPGGGPAMPRKLSFRALSILQIGHVYEGLLDHTAVKATEPVLGLSGSRDNEPEVPLSKLEALAAKGEDSLLEFVKDETGRSSVATVKRLLALAPDDLTLSRFRTACQGDEKLWERIKPFAGLVRLDTFDYPVVILPRSVYVTAGTDRRSSGTHYTEESLTKPIVQFTLEPLVYEGPAEGKPREQWRLRLAKELLDLNICDMACGSGAFLVQVCIYLAERLLEAWEEAEKRVQGSPRITPYGEVSKGLPDEQLIPLDRQERLIYARRLVAERCAYGVDKNPLAVEMAKLSLWLLTLAKDKPFTFLDHAIRCGDSLVGIHDLDQLRHFSINPSENDAGLFGGPLDDAVDEAIGLRLQLGNLPANTVSDIQTKEAFLRESEERMARLRLAADLLISCEFWGENAKDKRERVRKAAIRSGQLVENGLTHDFRKVAANERQGQVMFHWPLEFPEVIVKLGGFHVFVCNPPFMQGRRISTVLGSPYLRYMKTFHEAVNASADLVAYFVLRMFLLLRQSGAQGFIATQGIAEGDTRETCLDWLLKNRAAIAFANPDLAWPGQASVRVCTLGIWKDSVPKSPKLSDKPVSSISSLLTSDTTNSLTQPNQLKGNQAVSFTGTHVYGKGFVLDSVERERFISLDPRNAERIRPLLRGEDINRNPTQTHEDWIIDFGEMCEDEARQWPALFDHLEKTVKPERAKQTKQVHEPCFWKHWDKRTELYSRLSKMRQCLVHAFVGKHIGFAFVDTGQIIATPTPVFTTECRSFFAALQSSLHWVWVVERSSKMGTSIRYTPSDCFLTFPLPCPLERSELESVGAKYEACRYEVMATSNEGLTKSYNRFHDTEELATDIQRLRDLHVEMDIAVAAAYGWSDLDLGHGFHETKQGTRFTISESARREVLARLLKLNHERYAEEVAEGLHEKKGKPKATGRKGKKSSSNEEPMLF